MCIIISRLLHPTMYVKDNAWLKYQIKVQLFLIISSYIV